MFKELSMSAFFHNNAEKLKYKPILAYRDGDDYIDITWQQLQEMTYKTALYLKSIGIKKDDKIAIYSANRYEWWISDLAINTIGAINVPVHFVSSEEVLLYTLKDSEVKVCFVENDDLFKKIIKYKRKLPKLTTIIMYSKSASKQKGLISFSDIQEKAIDEKEIKKIYKIQENQKKDDIATLIYTSGTTGEPKGVMLTNNNFVSNVNQVYALFGDKVNETDVFLSFLPLSHVLERTAGFYYPIYLGAKVYFAESILTVQRDMARVRPTILISVPRIYEKIHTAILQKIENESPVTKMVFNFSQKVAEKNTPLVCQNKKPGLVFLPEYKLADKLVFRKLKNTLGLSNLKFAVSGGGPLSVSDAKFFIGMGLIILEGFGLTETSPVTNVMPPDNIVPGSVGPALKDTEIRISAEGEILIKGPQVMAGYYKNKKATSEVMTKDGFFKTGDIGIIDENGFLYITGRIKDIIVTSGGKNISPQPIENLIISSKYISQICIIGDKRKFLSALVIPEFSELKKFAKKESIAYSSMDDLVNHPKVYELILSEINKYTENLSRVEQLKKIKILNAEWGIESGELTATLKVRRNIIAEKYKKILDEIYAGDDNSN